MEVLCRIIKPYICPNCGQETLFFINKNNYLIDYKNLMIQTKLSKKKIIDTITQKRVIGFKCINCNATYLIDYTDGFPESITLDDCILKINANNT